MHHPQPTHANKMDTGTGSYGICREIDGCPFASDVVPLHNLNPQSKLRPIQAF